jgi:hypothetical protein
VEETNEEMKHMHGSMGAYEQRRKIVMCLFSHAPTRPLTPSRDDEAANMRLI